MTDLAGKLHMLCCRQELTPPPSFTDVPQLREWMQCMPPEEKRQFFREMGEYENNFAAYSDACFDQGVRFAFSLLHRLYPPEDFLE